MDKQQSNYREDVDDEPLSRGRVGVGVTMMRRRGSCRSFCSVLEPLQLQGRRNDSATGVNKCVGASRDIAASSLAAVVQE